MPKLEVMFASDIKEGDHGADERIPFDPVRYGKMFTTKDELFLFICLSKSCSRKYIEQWPSHSIACIICELCSLGSPLSCAEESEVCRPHLIQYTIQYELTPFPPLSSHNSCHARPQPCSVAAMHGFMDTIS